MKGDRVLVHIPSNCVYNSSMTFDHLANAIGCAKKLIIRSL